MSNKLSRKEIAKLTNRTVQAVGNSVRRGHLVEVDKLIDTDLKKNKLHLSKFITKEIERVEENEVPQPNIKKGINSGNIDYIIKQHDLKLKQVKLKKEKLDLSKKQAKLIEILEARDIFNRSIIVLSSQYRQRSKQYILDLAAKYDIPDTDLAGIQKAFDENINKAVKESKLLIKQECKVVSDNYAETLMQGESKD